MKALYLAGPITADHVSERWDNCMRARSIAIECFEMGLSVLCPHLNTLFMDSANMTHDKWIAADFELLRRMDGLLLLPGWEKSKGACMELKEWRCYFDLRDHPYFIWELTGTPERLREWAAS